MSGDRKHTPGGWRWTANRRNVRVLAQGLPVASVTSARAEEDARLIAAAPDMLAACEATLQFLDAVAQGADPAAEIERTGITAIVSAAVEKAVAS